MAKRCVLEQKLLLTAYRDRCIAANFPCFKIGSSSLNFVPKFKYLGHLITNDQSDDKDIQREIHNMFVRKQASKQVYFAEL